MVFALCTLSNVDRHDLYGIFEVFCEDSLNVFKVTERSQFCDRQVDRQMPGGGGVQACMHVHFATSPHKY